MTAKANRPTTLVGTAYHEAGHAVVAMNLGRGTRVVTIQPDSSDNTRGHVLHSPIWKRVSGESISEYNPPRRWQVEREIMILLSGGIAQRRFQGHGRNLGIGHDRHWAVRLADLVCESDEEAGAYLNWLHVRTEGLIASPLTWRGIVAVAGELLKRTTIPGRDVRKIIRDDVQRKFGTFSEKFLAKCR